VVNLDLPGGAAGADDGSEDHPQKRRTRFQRPHISPTKMSDIAHSGPSRTGSSGPIL